MKRAPETGPGEAQEEPVRRRRHRSHFHPGRGRTILLRLSEDEYGEIAEAAEQAKMTPTGYAAEAALAVAKGEGVPDAPLLREALSELMHARAQVRRYAVNVNQAVAQLNASGKAPAWLTSAVQRTELAVATMDTVAMKVSLLLPRRR